MSNEWLNDLDYKVLKYCQKLAKEKYNIDLELVKKGDSWILSGGNDAKTRQFGSGVRGQPAEFWIEKLKNDVYQEISLDKL